MVQFQFPIAIRFIFLARKNSPIDQFTMFTRSYATIVQAAPTPPTPVVAAPIKPRIEPAVKVQPPKPLQPILPRQATPVVKKVRKVGGIRGGFTGFLLGVTLTGAASYYYLLDEYKNANNVIIRDVVQLQSLIIELEKKIASKD